MIHVLDHALSLQHIKVSSLILKELGFIYHAVSAKLSEVAASDPNKVFAEVCVLESMSFP